MLQPVTCDSGAAPRGSYDPVSHPRLSFAGAVGKFHDGSDTPRAFLERCLQAYHAYEAEVRAFAYIDIEGARRAADLSTRRLSRGPAPVAGRRLPGRVQGHPRDCRYAHAAKQRAVCRLGRQARCGVRVGAAQGGGGNPGQDPGAGTGPRATAADAQPLRHPAHGGGLVERFRRFGRGGDGAGSHRQPDHGLADPPCLVQRQLRFQAQLGRLEHRRHASPRAQSGPHRPDGGHTRRHVACGAAHLIRCRRPQWPPGTHRRTLAAAAGQARSAWCI